MFSWGTGRALPSRAALGHLLRERRGVGGVPVHSWGQHAGIAGIGLGQKMRPMMEANTVDLAVTPQSPVSHPCCSFSLFGSCWRGEEEN